MTGAPAYHAPGSLDEALWLLHRLAPDATVLAGGQDIVPLMNQDRLHPQNLIDLKALSRLSAVQAGEPAVNVGALTTHRVIERSALLRARCGLLSEAAGQIGGGIQVRNRGTIGGALCSGNPAYDFGPCLVALDAEVRLQSALGERQLRAGEFFINAFATAARPDELLVQVQIPVNGANAGYAYEKLKFTDGCYCIASAACVARLGADGTFTSVRLALGGVEAVPVRLSRVEALLAGARLTDRLLDEIAALARQAVTRPIEDVMADGEYRRAMAGAVARRALARAAQRAGKARREGREG